MLYDTDNVIVYICTIISIGLIIILSLNCRDDYASPKVTLSLPQWQRWVSSGKNTLYGDAIIPGGTMDKGAVYFGHVRQGIGMYDPMLYSYSDSGYPGGDPSWNN